MGLLNYSWYPNKHNDTVHLTRLWLDVLVYAYVKKFVSYRSFINIWTTSYFACFCFRLPWNLNTWKMLFIYLFKVTTWKGMIREKNHKKKNKTQNWLLKIFPVDFFEVITQNNVKKSKLFSKWKYLKIKSNFFGAKFESRKVKKWRVFNYLIRLKKVVTS